jgi:hypothetical protein
MEERKLFVKRKYFFLLFSRPKGNTVLAQQKPSPFSPLSSSSSGKLLPGSVLAVDLPLRCPPLSPPHARIRPYEALSFPLASPSLALSPSSSL